MKNVVQDLTSAGIDWQREKWQSGLGSKFIHQGEKNAAKYADEVIVLSKGVQDYFKETYGRETHFIPNGVNQDKLPALLACPVNIYFSIFATTRNGLFQSLVFVSLGMYIADIEKSGELTKILHKGKIALFAYLIKIPISLIGGAVPQPDA